MTTSGRNDIFCISINWNRFLYWVQCRQCSVKLEMHPSASASVSIFLLFPAMLIFACPLFDVILSSSDAVNTVLYIKVHVLWAIINSTFHSLWNYLRFRINNITYRILIKNLRVIKIVKYPFRVRIKFGFCHTFQTFVVSLFFIY
jgi:hypothetical protein